MVACNFDHKYLRQFAQLVMESMVDEPLQDEGVNGYEADGKDVGSSVPLPIKVEATE